MKQKIKTWLAGYADLLCYQPAVLISDHSCCDQLIQEKSIHQPGAI